MPRRPARVTGVRLERAHKRNCQFRGQYFAYSAGQHYSWLSASGREVRKGRHFVWYRFTCNDPGCIATVIVRADKIDEMIKKGLR